MLAVVEQFIRNLDYVEDFTETIGCETCMADRSFCGLCVMKASYDSTEEEEYY